MSPILAATRTIGLMMVLPDYAELERCHGNLNVSSPDPDQNLKNWRDDFAYHFEDLAEIVIVNTRCEPLAIECRKLVAEAAKRKRTKTRCA